MSTQAPDWSQQAREIMCPLCGYNLRGLIDPRCPECGYQFEWDAVLNPPPTHPYLFETRPTPWRFLRTFAATLLPQRFWTKLEPTYEPRIVWLIVYWFLSVLMVLLGYLSLSFEVETYGGVRRLWFIQNPWITNGLMEMGYALVFWPGLTLAALMIFRISFARAKIRFGHVLRCAIYCADGGFWILLLIPFLLQPAILWMEPILYHTRVPAVLAAMMIFPLVSYRLAIACDRYLHIDHPAAVAICTQTIVLLVVVILAIN